MCALLTNRVTKFTINRKLWLNGDVLKAHPTMPSLLRHEPSRMMCCLGFYAVACGLSFRAITERGDPSELPGLPKQMEWLLDPDEDMPQPSTDCMNLMTTNDSYHISEVRRESEIALFFAAHGIEVVFEG
jgi:hypothetical protein